MNKIEFFHNNKILGLHETFPPVPASKAFPKWWKTLPKGTAEGMWLNDDPLTARACPAIRDWLTEGFVIPNWSEFIIRDNGDGSYQYNMSQVVNDVQITDWVNQHDVKQVEGMQIGTLPDGTVLKLENPWNIKTPPGWSVYMFDPFYHETHKKIRCLPGIVDTDMFHEISFPCEINLLPGETFKLRAGTPIMHIIPFKRNSEMELVVRSMTHEDAYIVDKDRQELTTYMDNRYNEIRKRKIRVQAEEE